MRNIKLFIMSFWIFFALLIVVTVDIPVCCCNDCEFIGWKKLLSIQNIIASFGLFSLSLGGLFYYQFMKELKGDLNIPVKIEKIENINYEYFALLVTIISLLAFNFTTFRGLILLIALLIILCAIFIKTELFYSNPSFALLGFHIYKVDSVKETLKGKIFITKDRLKIGDNVKYLKISEKVYFTKKA